MRTLYKPLLLAAALLCTAGSALIAGPYLDYDPLTGRINVGSASLFTVLAAGDVHYYDDTITGPSKVVGNIGIGGHADFSMSDGEIDGDLYMNSYGKFKMSGPAHFTAGHGVHNNQDTVLNSALSDAQMLSDSAAMEMSSAMYAGITKVKISNPSQNITIMGGPNEKIVLNLTDFVLSNGTFTLQGTTTTAFIINISGKFSINNSNIVLSGVPNANVLFNITGSGSQVSLNQGTSMGGILLATKRKVDLSGGKVYGRVIGDQVNITSGGQVISQ